MKATTVHARPPLYRPAPSGSERIPPGRSRTSPATPTSPTHHDGVADWLGRAGPRTHPLVGRDGRCGREGPNQLVCQLVTPAGPGPRGRFLFITPDYDPVYLLHPPSLPNHNG